VSTTVVDRVQKGEGAPGTPVASRDVRVGKDVLELLSTAMYVEPLVIYREYIQNAADSIDEARRSGLLGRADGVVEVAVDPQGRSVRVRDNGAAPGRKHFVERMTALGGSAKRGTAARGFRGVGRLAGLGHAQELVFRSRAEGEAQVCEVRWDCRALKAALANPDFQGGVSELVALVATVRDRPATAEEPARFFEVELLKVPRGRSDKLLGSEDVADYLAQVAPVPFHTDFSFGPMITERLREYPGFSEVAVSVNGAPVNKPHRDTVDIRGRPSRFEAPVFVEVPSQDGTCIAALAWFLHHGYEGALSASTLVKGIRLRVGNLQVGDGSALESLYTETRFNSWSVGEVHVFDQRLAPNGRRDQFEHNAHYGNLLNQLLPAVRDISTRCRTYSARRSKLRECELVANGIRERLEVMGQGGLDEDALSQSAAAVEAGLRRLETLTSAPLLSDARAELEKMAANLRQAAEGASRPGAAGDPLAHLPSQDQAFYRRMFTLIYAHSANRSAAKALVDRVIQREIGAGPSSA